MLSILSIGALMVPRGGNDGSAQSIKLQLTQTERPYLMIKAAFGIASALALFVSLAHAQTSSTTTTTTGATGNTTESTTTTTEASGTITDFTPGASIVLSTGSGEPTHYTFSKTVTYVTPSGKVIEASKVKKNSKVHVHYMKEGGNMVVDKVIVDDND
jgi:hypothetical protein